MTCQSTPPFPWRLAAAGFAASVLAASGPARAVTINFTNLSDVATRGHCAGGAYRDCKSTAHLSEEALGGDSNNFAKGFNAWNSTQPDNAKWTLVDGGALPGGDFTVAVFNAVATDPLGGMDFIVNWTYDGTDVDPKSGYVWTQGLDINYAFGSFNPPPGGAFALDVATLSNLAPCNNMDTAADWLAGPRTAGNYFCDPAYPYQTTARQLGDSPRGPWPSSSFEAFSFISKLDRTNRKLTIFEGIEWGFELSATPAPEPGTWSVMILGFGLTGLALRLRRGAVSP